jgi:endonuclease YncB( thermonuclease family)
MNIKIPATVERVIDGDTIEVSINFKFHVRVLDCWAEENSTVEGKRATEFARTLLPAQSKVKLQIPLLSKTCLPAMTFDRVVSSIETHDGLDFAATMVNSGYAKDKRSDRIVTGLLYDYDKHIEDHLKD